MFRLALSLLCLLTLGCVLNRNVPEPIVRANNSSSFIREQLIVHCDFDLPRQHRLLDDVTDLRGDIAAKLGLPASDESIHVYLFERPQEYTEFALQYFPKQAPRRAFFVETDTRLNVYAQWGDNVAEDLRHEVTHGYLHACVRNLPLWLDEGIAEYFEVPRARQGLNTGHVDLLAARRGTGDWSPDLARLEQLESAADMTQQDYAEAWLWVHYLLDTTPERHATLKTYLAELRRDGVTTPLSVRLREVDSAPHRSLAEHIDSCRTLARR